MVLVLPFAIKRVEENLEAFLFIMGVAASVVSGIMNWELALKALEEPWMIALAVFVAGAIFYLIKDQFAKFMKHVLKKVPVSVVVFLVILLLGLLSSVITAIVAAIILVEVIYLLPLLRKQKVVICIMACFSIGLGAALTPLGEPLATIAISKLGQDFFYLFDLLGKYIIPSVGFFSLLGGIYTSIVMKGAASQAEVAATESDLPEEEIGEESWQTIIVRSLKVYLFVMALVLLGEGFEPLIRTYILGLSPNVLYWVNMISAVLDNATLTAAEISPEMNTLAVRAILMGLLISGGMLIPGNIPNIISASKLKISSTEWAKIGVPVGLVVMLIFYILIFMMGL
jgi:predicted cation transporter